MREASGPEPMKALETFRLCVKDHLEKKQHMRAIAVAKKARSTLGPLPKVRALLIDTYAATGLPGDARAELEAAGRALGRKDLEFFRRMDDPAFMELLSMAEPVTYQKGRIVLKRHEKSRDVFVILEGICEVSRDGRILAVLRPGQVFGEIAFYGSPERSATVKTIERSSLLRLPWARLEDALNRNPCLAGVLDEVYGERVLKKAEEDMEESIRLDAPPRPIATLRFKKGQEIPVNPSGSVAILKHGVVEVDYDHLCLKTKRYYRPGSIISRIRARALAGTDVVIVLASTAGEDGKD
jgi:hypothetical protein